MSLRIVKGNLVGPSKRPLRQGDMVWSQGDLITNPEPSFVSSWETSVKFPSGEVTQIVLVADNAKDAKEERNTRHVFLRHTELFESRDDAITPIEIANGAHARPGDRVWVYVPSYKGGVEKIVVAYTSDYLVLSYEDSHKRVKPDSAGRVKGAKGCYTTTHKPEDIFASKEELLRKFKMNDISAAPLRVVHKVVKMA